MIFGAAGYPTASLLFNVTREVHLTFLFAKSAASLMKVSANKLQFTLGQRPRARTSTVHDARLALRFTSLVNCCETVEREREGETCQYIVRCHVAIV